MIHRTAVVVLAVAILVAAPASAAVMLGEFSMARESRDQVSWGDGLHNLRQEWSSADNQTTGYVYGSNYSTSNADVYNAGRTDPTTVADASIFPYEKNSETFTEGDTIFFRGTNGYYGAWVTHDVYPTGNNAAPYAYLDGTWFFQSDGTASFVPEPASLALTALSVLMLLPRRRRPPRPQSSTRTSPLGVRRV